MISTSRFLRPRRLISERRPTRIRPTLELLETRNLLTVALSTHFTGLSLTGDSTQAEPPDPIAATGPNSIVEMVNTDLAVYSKSGTLLSRMPLKALFPSDATLSFSDPQVLYDGTGPIFNGSSPFFVGALAYDFSSQTSHFDYATLDGADPTQVLSTNYLSVKEITNSKGATGTSGVPLVGDFPRVGSNASAYYVSFNMFEFTGSQSFDHVQVAVIAKSDLSPKNFWDAPSGGQDFTMVPAVMHDNKLTTNPHYADTTEWFVEERGFDNGSQLEVWQMINGLTTPVTGLAWVTVPAYGMPYNAPQPGSFAPKINTGDTRILTAAVRGNHLIATQNVGTGGAAHARWYDINLDRWNYPVVNNSDTLYQSGDINPGRGIYTYYPAADIDANGNLGLTYMESSKNEYMSMYVTGRAASDRTGRMQTPVLVQGGLGTYNGSRAGDYSSVSLDPSTQTFWAASEYSRGGSNLWGTAVANFSISAGGTLLAASSLSGGSGTSSGTMGLTGPPIAPLDVALNILYPFEELNSDKSHSKHEKHLASLGDH